MFKWLRILILTRLEFSNGGRQEVSILWKSLAPGVKKSSGTLKHVVMLNELLLGRVQEAYLVTIQVGILEKGLMKKNAVLDKMEALLTEFDSLNKC